MPQMSPLLWTIIIMWSISLLLFTSSFLYFMNIPSPSTLSAPTSTSSFKLFYFNWLW